MGGGGLRILPHKKWNVWNFDNRERVRKDEEQARKEEEERQERADEADQEARLEFLRKDARPAEQDAFVVDGDGVSLAYGKASSAPNTTATPTPTPNHQPSFLAPPHASQPDRAACIPPSSYGADYKPLVVPAMIKPAAEVVPREPEPVMEHINFFKHLEDGKVGLGLGLGLGLDGAHQLL